VLSLPILNKGKKSLTAFVKIDYFFFVSQTYIAHSANLPEGLYILLALISSFFNLRQISPDLLDRFSRSFHQMKGICVNFLDPDLFFIPLWTLPWQPMLGKICKVTFIQQPGILKQS